MFIMRELSRLTAVLTLFASSGATDQAKAEDTTGNSPMLGSSAPFEGAVPFAIAIPSNAFSHAVPIEEMTEFNAREDQYFASKNIAVNRKMAAGLGTQTQTNSDTATNSFSGGVADDTLTDHVFDDGNADD